MMSGASDTELHILNILFFVVHSSLMAFNLVGWAFRSSRKLHLVSVGATLFSWFVMGATKGFGYCLCTDLHFQIRRQLGLSVDVHTYLQLMAEVFLGIRIDRLTSDILTGGGLLLILIITPIAWIHDLRGKRLNFNENDRQTE